MGHNEFGCTTNQWDYLVWKSNSYSVIGKVYDYLLVLRTENNDNEVDKHSVHIMRSKAV